MDKSFNYGEEGGKDARGVDVYVSGGHDSSTASHLFVFKTNTSVESVLHAVCIEKYQVQRVSVDA